MQDRNEQGETRHNKRKGPRKPRKATPEYLERAALWYLERYASTSANLRRVLHRKVDRSARAHGTDPAEGREHVEALVMRFERAGLLDDARFAEGRARSLHERGTSPRGIRTRLRAKGVAEETVEAAMAALAEDVEDPAASAAARYARRRRIGVYRLPERRTEHRDRDLASLARNGFDLDTARAVVDAEDEADMLRILGIDAV